MGMIIGLIGIVIFVVIALSLAPTVANQTVAASGNANMTAAGTSLLNLTPLLYAVIIVVAILGALALRG
jgi:hypothetical protein